MRGDREGPQLAQFRLIEAVGGEPRFTSYLCRMPNCSEPCGGPPIERFWLRELLGRIATIDTGSESSFRHGGPLWSSTSADTSPAS